MSCWFFLTIYVLRIVSVAYIQKSKKLCVQIINIIFLPFISLDLRIFHYMLRHLTLFNGISQQALPI